MKEKEEDEERNDNICLQTNTQTIKQRTKSNSITEATLILCGSSGERANICMVVSSPVSHQPVTNNTGANPRSRIVESVCSAYWGILQGVGREPSI